MSINTIRSETSADGTRTITLVEITYELPGRGQNYTAWEFVCDKCDAYHIGLQEIAARGELGTHVCERKERSGGN